jgi:hypothetical protein
LNQIDGERSPAATAGIDRRQLTDLNHTIAALQQRRLANLAEHDVPLH